MITPATRRRAARRLARHRGAARRTPRPVRTGRGVPSTDDREGGWDYYLETQGRGNAKGMRPLLAAAAGHATETLGGDGQGRALSRWNGIQGRPRQRRGRYALGRVLTHPPPRCFPGPPSGPCPRERFSEFPGAPLRRGGAGRLGPTLGGAGPPRQRRPGGDSALLVAPSCGPLPSSDGRPAHNLFYIFPRARPAQAGRGPHAPTRA